MNSITASAPGRIDLSGGATDWCGMHTLSMAVNLRAYATITKLDDSRKISIKIGNEEEEYEEPQYNTPLDLFKAVIELTGQRGFQVHYKTDIPKGSGLGGSAPLTVSTVFALNELFQLGWSKYFMTELAQRAETLKMETVNGYQDQYTAMFGGVIFMDFNGKACQKGLYSKPIEEEPYAVVEDLTHYLPEFHIVVAVPEIERKGSDETNSSLSERYLNEEEDIVKKMIRKAELTQEAKKALIDGKIEELYEIINLNNDIMRDFGFVSPDNEGIISTALKNGAVATKTCGAGRGAVALFTKDADAQNQVYNTLKDKVKNIFKVTNDDGAKVEASE